MRNLAQEIDTLADEVSHDMDLGDKQIFAETGMDLRSVSNIVTRLERLAQEIRDGHVHLEAQ